jgi:predicted Fe-Mo cluster-binding NifX family protein
MKICIPTKSEDGKNSKVNEHFGSAPYFAIYNTDDSTLEFIENTNAHHSHGMCHPMTALSEQNIEVVICGGIGARALQKLN